MRLKRWESPRKQGRNNKGKGGSARKRQLKKQQQMLRQKLKGKDKPDKQSQKNLKRRQGEEKLIFPLFFASYQFLVFCPINFKACGSGSVSLPCRALAFVLSDKSQLQAPHNLWVYIQNEPGNEIPLLIVKVLSRGLGNTLYN